MQHASEIRRKVRRFPTVLIANLKEGVLLNCLAFRDLDEGLIVTSWPFNISQDELNCLEDIEND
jgi:hypothetical protein